MRRDIKIGWLVMCLTPLQANESLAFKPTTPDKQVTIEVQKFLAEDIRGRVTGLPSSKCSDYKIIVYVRTDKWYIHPYVDRGDGLSFARLGQSCDWKIETVTRAITPSEIAFLVVGNDYEAPSYMFDLSEIEFSSIYIGEWKEMARPWNLEHLSGAFGHSLVWGAGWIDLSPPATFRKGDTLRLALGGTATRIFVRFLPAGARPDTRVGIEGGIIEVPDSRILEMELSDDHENVTQISVHGGPDPFGIALGEGNGPATLMAAEVRRLPSN